MTDILNRLGDFAGMGRDALITVLAAAVDALGEGTEFTGEQIDRLGEIEGRLADMMRRARGDGGGADAGTA